MEEFRISKRAENTCAPHRVKSTYSFFLRMPSRNRNVKEVGQRPEDWHGLSVFCCRSVYYRYRRFSKGIGWGLGLLLEEERQQTPALVWGGQLAISPSLHCSPHSLSRITCRPTLSWQFPCGRRQLGCCSPWMLSMAALMSTEMFCRAHSSSRSPYKAHTLLHTCTEDELQPMLDGPFAFCCSSWRGGRSH